MSCCNDKAKVLLPITFATLPPKAARARRRQAVYSGEWMSRMRLKAFFSSFLLVVSIAALAQDEPKRGPSTPEERARFLALTHKLEQSPLDKDLSAEKDSA